jgi:hypothetical protein
VAEKDHLCWGRATEAGGLRVNPLALAESTYLFARLAQGVYEYAGPKPGGVEFGLAFWRMERQGARLTLTPGDLKSAPYQFGLEARHAPATTHEIRVVTEWPRSPGIVAYDLVREFYAWFGFDETAIPYVAEEAGHRGISAEQILTEGR